MSDRPHPARRAAALLTRLLLTSSAPLLAACSNPATGPKSTPPPVFSCTFTNPVGTGADPWVVRRNGLYYLIQSEGNGIVVYKSDRLENLRATTGVRVWNAPASGWNHANVWAPELHYLDGKWYIYYAASPVEGGPFIYQRSGVLESVGDDPQGAYVDRGMLYTGNDVAADTGEVWAIDLTVDRVNGKLYAVWSGWTDNVPAAGSQPDRKPQQLYIAQMSNPWTISSNRVQLSAPTAPWELGTELDLEEGPEFLQHGTDVYVVYSTRESWLPAYRLGQLRLASVTADPMNPANFTKSGPVFVGSGDAYGVGHASFTLSPDGTESWIVYHSKVSSSPGWDRAIRMQTFGWNADGSPNFGTPAQTTDKLHVPAGEPCGT
jgi:GH43 family beta-xylosidase